MMPDSEEDFSDQPVDLNHLRDITDGEEEIEKELFELFLSNSVECIAVLEGNITDGENMKWRGAAHELKGSSASLGAFNMSKTCSHAQSIFTGSVAEKETILADIKNEFTKVENFIKTLHAS